MDKSEHYIEPSATCPETDLHVGNLPQSFAGHPADVGFPTSQSDTADYLSDMLLSLYKLAKAAQLNNLLEPLETTYYKAHSLATHTNAPADHSDRLAKIYAYQQSLERQSGA